MFNALGKTGNSYTLRPRNGNMGIIPGSKEVPGPGSYEFKPALTSRGLHVLSKFKSSGATTFNPPQSKRYISKLDSNLGSRKETENNIPGPAEYTPRISIANTEGQFISNIPTAAGRTFYHFDRETLINKSTSKSNIYLLII